MRKARRSSLKSPEPAPSRATRQQRKQRAKSCTFERDPVAQEIEYDIRAPPIAIEETLAQAEAEAEAAEEDKSPAKGKPSAKGLHDKTNTPEPEPESKEAVHEKESTPSKTKS